ncbi:two-component system sensor histidine kinase PhoQ [Alteromonadaceae bacterium 2753L.S.0a.02]|nr:two-component system sensor histidine kinase PhoQ [Alteromonadaceae bacterium 2753L.S.0a.02]
MRLSLAARLALSSIIVLPLILGFSAFALDRAFQNSLRNAEREALRAQLYSLLGAAEPQPQSATLELPSAFAEPRFNRPLSGLFGVVLNNTQQPLWQSESAPPLNQSWLQVIEDLPNQAGEEWFVEVEHKAQPYFVLVFDSLWELGEKDQLFRFIIFHSQNSLKAELKGYRSALWQWLGGMALLFVIAQLAITRWGLSPLRSLAIELKKFQQGNKKQLDGEYPQEIAPVITNLNELLDAEQAQRQRYKNTLSDLAHSLKTPLAIVRAELEQKSHNAAAIDEQVSNMAAIIQHQLQRATLKSTTSIREKTPLAATLQRLTEALSKVYREKAFNVEMQVDQSLNFPGDESDALEIFGNLVENAFKYGRQTVIIGAELRDGLLKVSITDDGPGVPEHLQQTILSRGARADSSVQGQGIGLAVTTDILSSYGGQLEVSNGDHPKAQGAKFIVSIPL